MKASDLRTGNFLQYGNRIGRVVEIFSSNNPCCIISFDSGERQGLSIENNNCLIPLTKKWLRKFSFKADRNGLYSPKNCWHKYECHRSVHTENIKLGLQPGKNEPGVFALLYYVHQLQNLHHALTGEELTINPTPLPLTDKEYSRYLKLESKKFKP